VTTDTGVGRHDKDLSGRQCGSSIDLGEWQRRIVSEPRTTAAIVATVMLGATVDASAQPADMSGTEPATGTLPPAESAGESPQPLPGAQPSSAAEPSTRSAPENQSSPRPPGSAVPPPGQGHRPPSYGYPPPGYYGYPPPVYVYVGPDERPKDLNCDQCTHPPPGYVERTKIRKGFVIPGAATFGVTYFFAFWMANTDIADDDDGKDQWLMVPVVGPIIWGHTDDCGDYDENCEEPEAGWLLGLGQGVGITLFVAGLMTRDKYWLRQDLAGGTFTVAPTVVGRRAPGLGVTGQL
jgi:hypothetical protein